MKARDNWLAAVALIVSLASIRWPALWVAALPLVVVSMVVGRRSLRAIVGIAGIPLIAVSFGRFAIEVAPKHFDGVDIERNALDRIREIYWAESQAHTFKLVGEGEYLSFSELVGDRPARLKGRAPLLKPGLYHPIDPDKGIYETDGYYFAVYLPGKDGQPTRRAEDADPVVATRSFAAYGWPSNAARGAHRAWYVDQFEQICETDNPEGYVGRTTVPAPSAYSLIATAGVSFCGRDDDRGSWHPWALHHKSSPWSQEEVNEKKPRAER